MQVIHHFRPFEGEVFAVSTTRDGGVGRGVYSALNLCGYTGDRPADVQANRLVFCRTFGIAPDRLVFPRQTHGDRVATVDAPLVRLSEDARGDALEGVDALVTAMRGVCIGVATADCVPALFYDPVQRVAGVAHAGWRGTVGRIVVHALRRMADDYGCRPVDVQVTVAPCISAANYGVGSDLYDVFRAHGFPVDELFAKHPADGKWRLDLRAANCGLLVDAGVLPGHIAVVPHCTFGESGRFFSARRLGVQSGRMASCVMIRE
jgi:YfiH family protein